VYRGADAGTSAITVARTEDGNVAIRNEVTGAFVQTWETASTAHFVPLRAALGLGANDDHRRTMTLRYEGGRVVGTATKTDASSSRSTEEVAAVVPADVVDQRIDWAAVMALPLGADDRPTFTVFDPWTGASPVEVEVLGREELRLDAGVFEALRVAYHMDKRERGAETFVIWVSERPPRVLLRELFPNGAVTSLTSVRD
jgi:hypothetical protein